MAKKYFLDKRVFVNTKPLGGGLLQTSASPANTQLDLANFLDLEAYITEVVDSSATDFTSLNVDTINQGTAGTGITLSNTTNFPAGTVSLPSLTFTGDLDSGVYRIGANNIGVAANGAKVLDIATTGLGVTGTLSTTTSVSAGTVFLGAAGAVGAPEYSFTGQTDMGLYKVSSTQLGASVSGALVGGWNASGLFVDNITEKTSGLGITLSKPIIRKAGTAKAVNITGAITAAELAGGLVTSTSAAGVTATLPTATLLATQLGAAQGTIFEFVVDNSAGANTVTVAVNTGITVGTTAVTGGDSLTVSTAQVLGVFRLTFTSTTAAILRRIC